MAKIKITIEDLFDLHGAVIYNPDEYNDAYSVSIDSRRVKKNSIFVAIKGERFDGHSFIKEATKNGAGTIIINKKYFKRFSSLSSTIVTVDDTIKAYGELAKVWRKKLSAKVISLTGSNGKTSTKEMIATLLSEKYLVVKSEANNNNHIGVPLTIFSANEKTQVLILEHGTNHFNEIVYTAKIAQPDFALITNIGNTHLEFLNSKDGVYKEKSYLLHETESSGGKVLINFDDPILRRNSKKFKRKISYGFSKNADIKGDIIGFTVDGRTKIAVKNGHKKIETLLPVYGLSNAKNLLAAYVVAIKLGMTKKEIYKGIKKLKTINNRLNVKKKKKSILINDTYNSNPDSVKGALELIENIKIYDHKILIMGDMFELGSKSKKLHEELSKFIKKKSLTDIYLIGKYMSYLNKKLGKSKINSKHFSSRESLKKFLGNNTFSESVVLVKGSRGMHMEEFYEIIDKKAA